MTRTATRQQLIDTGREIIAQQGFGTTGINAVLSNAGVPKGSFYYYFKSKEDFGLAVIDASAQSYAERLAGFLTDTEQPPLQRIRNYLEDGLSNMSDDCCSCGCLIGNLGQELSGHNEVFRQRLNAVFQSWEQQFSRCLGEARCRGDISADSDPDQLAQMLLIGWEGAILRAKVTKSTEPMQVFISVLFDRLLNC